MDKYIEKLRNKYNYDDKMINFLSQLIPALIEYHGLENTDKILDAIYHCTIHIQEENENPKDYLAKFYRCNSDDIGDFPSLGTAFYNSNIKIENSKISSHPIIYIITKDIVSYNSFDFKNVNDVWIIVHEINHLIKTYNNFNVFDDKVVVKSGLIEEIYLYDNSQQNGLNFVSEKMVGIEEAFNEFDTFQVMKKLYGEQVELHGYKAMAEMAEFLSNGHPEFAQIVHKCQFNGKSQWMEYFDKDITQKLIDSFDIMVNVTHASLSDLFDDKKFEEMMKNKDDAENFIYDVSQMQKGRKK